MKKRKMAKKNGGVILKHNDICSLFTIKDSREKGRTPIALAFKAEGWELNSRNKEHSCKISVFAVFKDDDGKYYINPKIDPYRPTEGRYINLSSTTKDSLPKPENIRFEHYKNMNKEFDVRTDFGPIKKQKFCFSMVSIAEIKSIFGFGIGSETIDKNIGDLFLSSIVLKYRNIEAFSFALQEDSTIDFSLMLTAPCPPYWKFGVPSDGKDFIKEEEALLDFLNSFCSR